MQGQRAPFPSPDWFLRELAERQHGVFAWWQLRSAGFTRGQVDSRLARGLFRKVHRGVYAFGHDALTPKGRWMAAVVAFGEHAVLSHRSAAALWEVLPTTDSAFIHVSSPGRHRQRRRSRLIVHGERVDLDVTVRYGIPVTSPQQTLLDLAVTVGRHTLGQAIDAAEKRGLLDRRTWTPPTGRPGALVLRDAVGVHRPAPTRSELERRFLELCREHGIEPPLVNTVVAGIEVDFFWPRHGLVVETDGAEFHDGRRVSRRDRDKETRLALAGFRTERFDWEQIVDEPTIVARVLTTLTRG